MRMITTAAIAAVALGSAVALAAASTGGAAIASATAHHGQAGARATDDLPALQLAHARLATARYATDLDAAKADGYKILTREIPGMGFHFINPGTPGSAARPPPILVYEKHGDRFQLAALEWV